MTARAAGPRRKKGAVCPLLAFGQFIPEDTSGPKMFGNKR